MKPNKHGGQQNIIGLEATWYGLIGENLGALLKFADKMFMKQKMTKNWKQKSNEWWKIMMKQNEETWACCTKDQIGLDLFMLMP